MSARPDWDTYFIQQCNLVATRATCDRKHVGAVIVKDRRLLSTGYNGSLPGLAHCNDPGKFFICPVCYLKTNYVEIMMNKQTICNNWLCSGNPVEINGGHDMKDGHCIGTVHAEVNAIAQAAALGISTKGATMYCNTYPCWNCFKTIVSAGIVEMVYQDDYKAQHADRVTKTNALLSGFVLRKFQSTRNNSS